MKNARTMDEVQGVLRTASKDIERATTSVNGLLTDIMEIGSPRPPQQEIACVDTLVKNALTESFKSHPAENIRITHNFSHTRDLHIDTRQVQRVFLNIIGNAIQALGSSGEIWIESHDHIENGAHHTLFALGNNGPEVPPAHCGKIWYENVPPRGIQFCFTLPSSSEPALPPTTKIPHESAQFLRETQITATTSPTTNNTLDMEKFNIAVVDDDALFLMAWDLASTTVRCDTFTSPEEFLARLSANPNYATSLTAVVTDFHFDNSSMSGIDLGRRIKQHAPNTPVYICSNADNVDADIAIAGTLPKNAEDAITQLMKHHKNPARP